MALTRNAAASGKQSTLRLEGTPAQGLDKALEIQVQSTLAKLTVKSKASGISEEIYLSIFDFSRDWKKDREDIISLEKKAFPEKLRCTEDEIRGMLSDESVIAVVARNAKGRVTGMAYGIGWQFEEKVPDNPKANGGEKEAFDELPVFVGSAIGRGMPKDEIFYIHSIAVLPDFQRQLIGTNLVMGLLSKAGEKNRSVFVCHAMVETGSATMFEKVLGVAKIKDYSDWYGTGFTARLLATDLSQKQAENGAASNSETAQTGTVLRQLSRDARSTEFIKARKLSVPHVVQTNDYNCGPACLKAIFAYYGVQADEAELAKESGTNEKDGTSYAGLIKAVDKLGFRQESKNGATIREIEEKIDAGIPVIVAYKLNSIDCRSLPIYPFRKTLDHVPKRFWRIKERLVVGHYSIVVGYDDKDLFVLNVATGNEVMYEKTKFDKAWYDDEGERWMMAITPQDRNRAS